VWVEVYLYSTMTTAVEVGEWSAARPGHTLPPGKNWYPISQEAGWAPGPVWKGGKSRPQQDSITDRPVRSQSLYRQKYPAHIARVYVMIFPMMNVVYFHISAY